MFLIIIFILSTHRNATNLPFILPPGSCHDPFSFSILLHLPSTITAANILPLFYSVTPKIINPCMLSRCCCQPAAIVALLLPRCRSRCPAAVNADVLPQPVLWCNWCQQCHHSTPIHLIVV